MSSSLSRSAQLKAALGCSLLLVSLPLACAVGVEPAFEDIAPEGGTRAGGGAGPIAVLPTTDPAPTTGGSRNPFGGATATGGVAAGGKGGNASAGSAGSRSGGAGGSDAAAGASTGGAGGGSTTGCATLKTWQGGEHTFTVAAGEVIQWMGKRYKATAAITYANPECKPDDPMEWCKAWFSADGDC